MSIKLGELYEHFFSEYLQYNTILATHLGYNKYNNSFPNIWSKSYIKKLKKFYQYYLNLIETISININNKLEYINYQSFKILLKYNLEYFEYNFHLFPINQMDNIFIIFLELVMEKGYQTVNTYRRLNIFKQRLKQFSKSINSLIKRLQEGINKNCILPKIVVDQVINQLKEIETIKPYYRIKLPIKLKNIFIKLMDKFFIEALIKVKSFLTNEYYSYARDTIGLYDISNGSQMYDYLVKVNTSLPNLSTDMILDIANGELFRLNQQKKLLDLKLKKKEQIDNTRLNNGENGENGENRDIIAEYMEYKEYISKNILPEQFGNMRPKTDYLIKPVPKYNEASSPTAYYMLPSINGNRPGVFYINLRNLDEHIRSDMLALTLHEGCPGHHYQIALSQDYNIPKFRAYGELNAFFEGWGLYCEGLADYKDSESLKGRYNYQSLRICRLLIDIGIHRLGWKYDKCYQLLKENTSLKASEITSEINRYIAIPGQALSYKIGELYINKLKHLYLKKYGNYQENIIKFHQSIIKFGPVPLELLNYLFSINSLSV